MEQRNPYVMSLSGDAPEDTNRRSPLRISSLGVNQHTHDMTEDIEMAHDELFSGPVAESLPTSISAFPHHRERSGSISSFAYYAGEDEVENLENEDSYLSDFSAAYWAEADARLENGHFDDSLGDESEGSLLLSRSQSTDEYSLSRRTSFQSRASARSRLIRRDSLLSSTSGGFGPRTSQKVYMASEDLTIVIAGFRNSRLGTIFYNFSCVFTVGLAYLFLRWLPKLRIRLIGIRCPLSECDWVVVENQWGELSTLPVRDVAYGRTLSTVFGQSPEEYHPLNFDPDPELERLRMVDYRYVRFCYHPGRGKFVLCNGWQDPSWKNVMDIRSGLEGGEKESRELVFGQNMINIEQKSTFQLLVDEVLHPFYMFQVASLVLWCADEYYYYAVCIFLMSVISISTTLIETRSTMKRLRDISRFECNVRVLRSGFWRSISSLYLVPGDVYELSDPNLHVFPSDSLLLSGDCIVNESMLTGESVPVSKTPAVENTLRQLDLSASTISVHVVKHFLFCGTKIVRVRRSQDGQQEHAVALAMVVRTGFNTTKGALVRSMLFPKPSGFKFYRDSFRYISFMACVAILGFIVSFINFVRLRLSWHLILIRALDLITIIVPPALPATLTIGTNFALSRLKKKEIFCISPQRVNVAGKVDLMCFDKTGTLTEDGLDILGVLVVRHSLHRFSDLISSPSTLADIGSADVPVSEDIHVQVYLLQIMATCHSLRIVDGQLVGDPLDLKMFGFTKWSFEEGGSGWRDHSGNDHSSIAPSVARPPPTVQYTLDRDGNIQGRNQCLELGIIRSFEFVSQLRRASVVVRPFGSQSCDIYVKGAPECMREICQPETFPSDYDELLAYYTHKGYRVIACAVRHMKKLNWLKAQKMKRAEAECHLDFVGFIIFENKLKPSTSSVIDELRSSNIPAVMCTGDNILTAVSVARECNLVDEFAQCFVARFTRGDSSDPNSQLGWESIDDPACKLHSQTLTPLSPLPEGNTSMAYATSNFRNYALGVTGDIFRWIVDHGSAEVLKRVLVCGRVFARMSPDEKHELIEKLQSIGYCCGFCGDGANDCGALKAADIGISLSEAEASVAAPFTSRVFDIRCVPTVIREGRAALVTSFSCFKYMSLYSAIQFTSVSFLYASASNLGDFQFLYIDLLLILPIAVFMSWAGPFPFLTRKRPTANLVSRKVLTPLIGHMAVCAIVQALVLTAVRRQPWYIAPRVSPNKSKIKNSENTALFLVSCFQYILVGVILNAGPPFRQGMLQNWPFVATITASLSATTYLVFGQFHALSKLMQLTKTSSQFNVLIVGLGLMYFFIAWVGEKYMFQFLARLMDRCKQAMTKKPKKRKEYKEIQQRVREDM